MLWMLSCVFLISCLKVSNVNSFFKAVMVIVAFCLVILSISLSVFVGFGVFCRRVMAKTLSKVWFLNGV